MTRKVLFRSRGRLSYYLRQRQSNLSSKIDSYKASYILGVDPHELKKALIDSYRLTTPVINESKIFVDESEVKVDVSQDWRRDIVDRSRPFMAKKLKISYHIRFKGDSDLFNYEPSSSTTNPPVGYIKGDELVVEIIRDNDSEYVKTKFERNLNEIKRYLSWIDIEITQFNSELDSRTEREIRFRRDKLIKDKKFVSDLGYPLKKREDRMNTYVAPDIKRKIPFPKPEVIKAEKPEATLSPSHYDDILKIISNMADTMERSPKAFSTMDEENIRHHLLVQLNGLYEGRATGETFNYEGKTDILIRVDGKNIFVAECKFWQGKEKFIEAIDQILGYLSWRDTKAAIILFNKNKNLSNVLKQIPEIVKSHKNFKKELEYRSDTGFRFILSHKDDNERDLYLTVLAFDVPR